MDISYQTLLSHFYDLKSRYEELNPSSGSYTDELSKIMQDAENWFSMAMSVANRKKNPQFFDIAEKIADLGLKTSLRLSEISFSTLKLCVGRAFLFLRRREYNNALDLLLFVKRSYSFLKIEHSNIFEEVTPYILISFEKAIEQHNYACQLLLQDNKKETFLEYILKLIQLYNRASQTTWY